MDYGKILTNSFTIFWTHKPLWLFGIIATIFGQGDYSFRINYTEGVRFPAGTTPSFNPFEGTILERMVENPLPYIITMVSLSLVWWIISTFFGWFAQGSLIGMADEIDRTGSTSLYRGWQIGRQHALSLFFIALILSLPVMVIVAAALLTFWPLFSEVVSNPSSDPTRFVSTFFNVFSCLFPLICVGVLLTWFLSLLNLLAARSCVLEELGPLASIRRGGAILGRNIGYTLLNSFILGIIGGIFGAVIAAPALILWIPAARAFLHNDWSPGAILALIGTGLYFATVGLGLGGILTSFNATVWTNLYKAFLAKETA